jgi:hypothetical protein
MVNGHDTRSRPEDSGTAAVPGGVSMTAYWPHFWKRGQLQQSAATFSGSQVCGTIENPNRTKNRASCVNAHSVR